MTIFESDINMITIFESDIDFETHGIEVISDAYKFTLPVPRLKEELTIQNYTDQSNQRVALDGTGIIIFNFSGEEEAKRISPKIKELIQEQNEDINGLTAPHIKNIVSKARSQLGLGDIYTTNKDFVQTKLKPISSYGANKFYGLHQRNITECCKAVYIKVSFKGRLYRSL